MRHGPVVPRSSRSGSTGLRASGSDTLGSTGFPAGGCPAGRQSVNADAGSSTAARCARHRYGGRCYPILVALLAIAMRARPSAAAFVTFESGQVRPLALSPDGQTLLALNTPDARLEIFAVGNTDVSHVGSVSVGLEPVAVAARTDTEVWVVNHLSDSVSIVSVDSDGDEGRVVRTLLVGDEPRDIVFAGPGRDRAFITTAHRGQNSPIDPQLTTPGVGRSDEGDYRAIYRALGS